MNDLHPVHHELVDHVFSRVDTAKLYTHPACKTSEESRAARLKASGELVAGAKALLLKLENKSQNDPFILVVLPGINKLDSKALKQELKERISGTKNFRFASPDEMKSIARDMQPGKMPPFGRPFFPDITYTFIDKNLLEHERIGFNVAEFEKSIIMPTADLVSLIEHDGIFLCSVTD